MHRSWPIPVVRLTCLLLAAPAPAQSLAALVAGAEQRGIDVGISVRRLDDGAAVYSHAGEQALLPASNQKILTAAAALWALGPDYEFRTGFRLRKGVLQVVPGGDPNWLRGSEHAAEKVFARVRAGLRRHGVQRLRGVRLLHEAFPGPIRPEGWPKDQYARTYCAPTAGLVLDASCFEVRIHPRPQGRARLALLSPPLAAGVGGAVRIDPRRRKRYSYWVSHGEGGFRGHGKIGAHVPSVTVRGVVQTPLQVFEQSLRHSLSQAGLQIDPSAPARDLDVHTERSSLATALGPILAESSNFHAEQLLRVLGREAAGVGDFAHGLQVLRDQLREKLGKLPAALRFADGSGLSRGNRVSANFLVRVLRELCVAGQGKLFVAKLARRGRVGTLQRKFGSRPKLGRSVWAKTGTIRGVKALSGLLRRPDGEVLVFSILLNSRKRRNFSGAFTLQEKMLAALFDGEG